jgi:hypothetical protein
MQWIIGILGWLALVVIACLFLKGASMNDPNKDK